MLIEHDVVAALDTSGEMGLDLSECQRGRQQNSPLRGGAGNLADGEKRLARQRGRRIEIGATVGALDLVWRAVALLWK